jgi:3-phytase
MKNIIYSLLTVIIMVGCKHKNQLPAIAPNVITENTLHDTDDPAIWVNRKDPSASIVFGTDKDTDGAVYAFNLQGKIIEKKTIRGLKRPNNVDIRYDFKLNDSIIVDVMVFTERERQQFRMFSIPDMKPIDGGGFPVFVSATEPEHNLPMGISLYHSPKDSAMYAIVGRKAGPLEGYLHQYLLKPSDGRVKAELVREFGNFSGKKEIEAIAVDDANGIVYYSDEGKCIRKYYAEPSKGNQELSCFGESYFRDDIEGIALANGVNGRNYIIVSNQQNHSFVIFDGSDLSFVKEVNLSTTETDGCEVTTTALGSIFPNGLFVAMNDERNFYFYDLGNIL